MKKKLTSEELLKLPKEKFITYIQDMEEDRYKNMQNLNFPYYDEYSFDDKVNLWTEELNQSMRNQAQSGLDEYFIYKPIWYQTMKRLEPDFDSIIDKVFEKFAAYGWKWSKEEYFKRIHENL